MKHHYYHLSYKMILIWILSLVVSSFGIYRYIQSQGLRNYNTDDAIYTYVGWSWDHGFLPYKDSWDHKGPLVYLITSIRTHYLGNMPESLGYQEIALGIIAAAFVGLIANVLWGGYFAPLAFILSILLWTQIPAESGFHSTPGSLLVCTYSGTILFTLLAIKSSRNISLIIFASFSGLLAGLSLSIKPNEFVALFVSVFIILINIREVKSYNRIFLFLFSLLIGLITPIIIVSIYFYTNNALREFFDAYIIYNVSRGSLFFIENLKESFSELLSQLRKLNFILLFALFGLVFFDGILSWLSKLHRISFVKNNIDLKPLDFFLLIWIISQVILIILNGSFDHHVFTLIPVLTLASIWSIVKLSNESFPLKSVWLPIIIIGLFFTFILNTSKIKPPDDHSGRRSLAWQKLIKTVEMKTEPNDYILSLANWDGPWILTQLHRHSPSRFIYPVPLYSKNYTSDSHWKELFRDVREKTPKYILLLEHKILGKKPDNITKIDYLLKGIEIGFLPNHLKNLEDFKTRKVLQGYIKENYHLEKCFAEACILEVNK